MKKMILTLACVFALTGACAYAQDGGIAVFANGKKVEFDAMPEIVGNRVMVPVRAVAEALGQEVRYYEKTKTIGFSDKGLGFDRTLLKVGSDKVLTIEVSSVAKEEKTDAVPFIKKNRTYVPLRAVAEALDCEVDWEEDTRTVTVERKYTDGLRISGTFRRMGVIDKDGNMVVPRSYDSVKYKNGHFVAMYISYVGKFSTVDIYDRTGKEILTLKNGITGGTEGYLFIKSHDGVYNVISPEGEFVLKDAAKAEFDEFKKDNLKTDADGYDKDSDGTAPVLAWREAGAAAQTDGGWHYGYLSPECDRTVISIKYEYATPFCDGYAKVKENGKWKIIDEEGRYTSDKDYDSEPIILDGYVVYSKDNLYGADSINGQEVFAAEWQDISISSDDVIAERDSKYGMMTLDGTVVLPFEYDELTFFGNGLIRAKRGGRYGVVAGDGSISIPFEYDWLYLIENGWVYAQKDGKCGFIDQNARVIIPPEYDCIRLFPGGNILAGKNSADDVETDGMFVLDGKGSIIASLGKIPHGSTLIEQNGYIRIGNSFVNGEGEVFEAQAVFFP